METGPEDEAGYWGTTATTWQETHPQELWRACSDAVNIALFARWLPDDSGQIERLLKTDLFDEACTDGLYPLLASRARSVVGVDMAAVTASAARARCAALRATVADVRRLPLATGAFDAIVSSSTLDHFRSSDEIVVSLGELHRVLKAGGQLLLTLDNAANPVVAVRNALPFRMLNRIGIVPYYVGATFGPRRVRRILRQVGFEVLEVEAVLHCPRVFAVAVTRILGRRAGARVRRALVGSVMAFEGLARWPTRFLTGYFLAVRAIKTETTKADQETTTGEEGVRRA